MAPGLPLYRLVRVSSDGAVSETPCRLMGVLMAMGQADSTVEFTNDSDGLSTNIVEFSYAAEQGGSQLFDLTSLGGVMFSTALYADITGASMILYCWVDG